ncbi:MAG: PAS domain S-box protein [Sphingobacteriaceae bacterium]|nr:MAG: PAS domain S-box protein [Sphingobacteriaceae bacterium]
MKCDQPRIIEAEMLFDISPDLLCYFESDGHFIKVNNAFAQALGYTKEELLSKPFLDFIIPQDWEPTNQQLAILARNETVCEFKNRYRCLDGKHKWLSWNAFRLPNGAFFASARDVTLTECARIKLVRANEQNERRLISLIESGNDIILILSAQGVYQFVSPSVRTIFQTDPAFYLDKVTFQFIHPEDLEWVGAEFNAVMETEEPVYIPPFRFQIGSGDWVWIETIATNRLSDPAIEGIVINAKDVTTRRKQEQEKLLITK